MYLSELVAEGNFRRSAGKGYEEILEVKVHKETLLQTQAEIKKNLSKFANILDMKQSQEDSVKHKANFDFSILKKTFD